MAEINVSIEALRKVGRALYKFQRDIESFPTSVIMHIAELERACFSEVLDAERELNKLKLDENSLIDQKGILEMQYNSLKSEAMQVKSSCENEISRLNFEIANTNATIEYLRQNAPYSEEISILGNVVAQCYVKIDECRYKISRYDYELSEIEWRLEDMKNQLRRVTDDRIKAEDKLSRLRSAYYDVEREADNLSSVIKRFHRNTMDTTGEDISSINRCITLVEEYMHTNL